MINQYITTSKRRRTESEKDAERERKRIQRILRGVASTKEEAKEKEEEVKGMKVG